MSDIESKLQQFQEKMRKEGLSESAIAAFSHSFKELASGNAGMIAESTIEATTSIPDFNKEIKGVVKPDPKLLKETVVLKLNGGLGTSMGLDKAKSLLEVKNKNTFLDLTAKQIIKLRKNYKLPIKFMLMNSFNTSKDTLDFLSKYSSIVEDSSLELMQNKVPKVDKSSLLPAEWSVNRHLEWCPPGHGDLYTALHGSGQLQTLLDQGIKYLFVSNSDNLGATLDLDLLTHFAQTGLPFMMECCERTEADKKGGHLATRVKDKQLVLRESAQCAKSDEAYFQNIQLHKYFNTNNLWIRLDMLNELMSKSGGFVPLPTIFNNKTVDPQQDTSTPVVQLETAMGAAIECFPGAGAVCVSRERFAPVKKCSDLLLLRSDAYCVDSNSVLVLNEVCGGIAPIIELDDKKYKLVQHLEAATEGGYPSLVKCKKLSIKGEVWLSSGNIFEGNVRIINESNEPKVLPAGTYKDTTVDLTQSSGLGVLKRSSLSTIPYNDQKPGTSGLRKKTRIFKDGHLYLENFVQSTFNALTDVGTNLNTGSLLLGGDGRYYNDQALQTIIKMAAAQGVRRVIVGQNGLLSTPAISSIIREHFPLWQRPFGAFILTASHNPGGPEEDFGIKYNCENGGPAPESLTDAIYAHSKIITSVKTCSSLPVIDLSRLGTTEYASDDGSVKFIVDVISSTDSHVNLLKSIFDFNALQHLVQRPDFSMVYDCMSGVQGPYARAVFVDTLGLPLSSLLNYSPKQDFNGQHADPNLTYARDVCNALGVDVAGSAVKGRVNLPCFGAAADGDADRNMILGRGFFVTPSDSLAVLAAHAHLIPFFSQQGGLRSVARSMPTSRAVDRVAAKLNLRLFETPTGWKFFGNVMDSEVVFNGPRFGPESFGTGSDHIREKDGMWAVLMWLSVLAHYNKDHSKPFVHIEDIVRAHWLEFGRNFYTRYDYENVESSLAAIVINGLREKIKNGSIKRGDIVAPFEAPVEMLDEFTYEDPIDGSISTNQGIRLLFLDGSRVIYRLSGTAGSGATIRIYFEKYVAGGSADLVGGNTADALNLLVAAGLAISNIHSITKRESPSVIT